MPPASGNLVCAAVITTGIKRRASSACLFDKFDIDQVVVALFAVTSAVTTI
jgi:hypothetical protein